MAMVYEETDGIWQPFLRKQNHPQIQPLSQLNVKLFFQNLPPSKT